ncbi:hypothetical protein IF2G_02291 [Cordyceps javanica]|nr:hypothetical protein IF2G_02291 [Cordyceps javanica]
MGATFGGITVVQRRVYQRVTTSPRRADRWLTAVTTTRNVVSILMGENQNIITVIGIGNAVTTTRRAALSSSSRQMFPFVTAWHTLAVTGIHILVDIKDCDGGALEVFHMVYAPPHRPTTCPDTKNVPFVRTASGMWRGVCRIVPDVGPREARGLGGGLIGTFQVPYELKDVLNVWVLYDYKVVYQVVCGEASLRLSDHPRSYLLGRGAKLSNLPIFDSRSAGGL